MMNRFWSLILPLLFTFFYNSGQAQCMQDPVVQQYKQKLENDPNTQSCSLCAALAVYYCSAEKIYKQNEKIEYRNVIGKTISNIREMGNPICCPELLTRQIKWGTNPESTNTANTTSDGSDQKDLSGSFNPSTVDGAIKSASWGLGKTIATGTVNEDLIAGGLGLAANIGMGIANKNTQRKREAARAKSEELYNIQSAKNLLNQSDDPQLQQALKFKGIYNHMYFANKYAYGIISRDIALIDLQNGKVNFVDVYNADKKQIWDSEYDRFNRHPEDFIKVMDHSERVFVGTSSYGIHFYDGRNGAYKGTLYPPKDRKEHLTRFDLSPSNKYLMMDSKKGLVSYNLRTGEFFDQIKWKDYFSSDGFISVESLEYTDVDRYVIIKISFGGKGYTIVRDNQQKKFYKLNYYFHRIKKIPGKDLFCVTDQKGSVYIVPIADLLAAPNQYADKGMLVFDFKKVGNQLIRDHNYAYDGPIYFDWENNMLITTSRNKIHFHNLKLNNTISYYTTIPWVNQIFINEDTRGLFISGLSLKNIGMTKGYDLSLLEDVLNNQNKIIEPVSNGVYKFSGKVESPLVEGVLAEFKQAEFTGMVIENQLTGHGVLEDERYIMEGDFFEGRMIHINRFLIKDRKIKYEYFLSDGILYAIKTFLNDSTEIWKGETRQLMMDGDVIVYKSGRKLFAGEMDEEVPVNGFVYFEDGSRFFGDLDAEYQAHGQGEYLDHNDSLLYTGNFVHGSIEGEGTYYYENGGIYNGSWKSNKRNGFGKYYYSEESTRSAYSGEWANGKKHGAGQMVYKDGSWVEGEWAKGKVIRIDKQGQFNKK